MAQLAEENWQEWNHNPTPEVADGNFQERWRTRKQPACASLTPGIILTGTRGEHARMEAEREKRWRVIEAIGARNAGKDPKQVEHDIAEAIQEVREEERASVTVMPHP
jgi:hypothetical protein